MVHRRERGEGVLYVLRIGEALGFEVPRVPDQVE